MRCEALSKRTGRQCGQHVALGRRTCRWHGGASLAGPFSPTWRHGKYSAYLPADLIERYQEGMNDPDLLALTEQIALVEARLIEVVAGITHGDSRQFRADLDVAYGALLTAIRSRDVAGISAVTDRLGELIRDGGEPWAAWDEAIRLMSVKARLVLVEERLRVAKRQVLTATEALTMAAAMAEVVKEYVPDPADRRAIVDDLARILGRPVAPDDGRFDA